MKHRCEDLEERMAEVVAGEPGGEEKIEALAAALACENCRRQLAQYQGAFAEMRANFMADPVALELGPERLAVLRRMQAELVEPASDPPRGAGRASYANRDWIIFFPAPLRRAMWWAAVAACAALASIAGFEAADVSRERRAQEIVRSLSNDAPGQSADSDANLLPRGGR
jgi:hypothetical protein